MSWNIKTPGDFINGPLTVAGVAQFNSNVGIGVTPSSWGSARAIDIGTGLANGSLSSFGDDTNIATNAYYNAGWKFTQGTYLSARYRQSGGGHQFYVSNSNGGAGTAIPYAQALTLTNTGILALYTGNQSANGIGIAFPAAQSASTDANTLDDYEEGTWTGTLKGSVSDPTTPVTATGRYTKIGRQVTVQISFEGVTTTGASGTCFVTGLPFTNTNVRTVGSAASFLGLTFTGTLVAIIDGSATQFDFIDTRSNAAWVQAPHNAGTGRTISASLTYNV